MKKTIEEELRESKTFAKAGDSLPGDILSRSHCGKLIIRLCRETDRFMKRVVDWDMELEVEVEKAIYQAIRNQMNVVWYG